MIDGRAETKTCALCLATSSDPMFIFVYELFSPCGPCRFCVATYEPYECISRPGHTQYLPRAPPFFLPFLSPSLFQRDEVDSTSRDGTKEWILQIREIDSHGSLEAVGFASDERPPTFNSAAFDARAFVEAHFASGATRFALEGHVGCAFRSRIYLL